MKAILGFIVGIIAVAICIGLWVAKKALLIAWSGAVFGVKFVLPAVLLIALIGWIWYKIKKA